MLKRGKKEKPANAVFLPQLIATRHKLAPSRQEGREGGAVYLDHPSCSPLRRSSVSGRNATEDGGEEEEEERGEGGGTNSATVTYQGKRRIRGIPPPCAFSSPLILLPLLETAADKNRSASAVTSATLHGQKGKPLS